MAKTVKRFKLDYDEDIAERIVSRHRKEAKRGARRIRDFERSSARTAWELNLSDTE